MFWKTKPTVDLDTAEWIASCWEWLNETLGPVEIRSACDFIYPSRNRFRDTNEIGHRKAEHYLALVNAACGMSDWPVELRAQAVAPQISDGIVFAEQSLRHALGTFRRKGNAAVITYEPGLLNSPMNLIATLVHELAHYALAQARTDPPGGPELEELATDLATVHMGFGLFGANTAFEYRQAGQGWSIFRSGYLGENGWCFANALYAEILGIRVEAYRDYVKPSVANQIAKNRTYLAANPEISDGLRLTVVRSCPDRAQL